MKFELGRTMAYFAKKYQGRIQGAEDHAIDISFSITTDADVLLMLAPAIIVKEDDSGEEKRTKARGKDNLVEELFSKEGYVKRPSLSPIAIHRKPEGISVTIHDQEKNPMTLVGCSFKNLSIELKSPKQVVVSGLIQYARYNNNELIRINSIMGKHVDIEWFAEQDDLFSKDDSKAKAKDDKQDPEKK